MKSKKYFIIGLFFICISIVYAVGETIKVNELKDTVYTSITLLEKIKALDTIPQTDKVIQKRRELLNIMVLIDNYERDKAKLVKADIVLKDLKIKRAIVINYSIIAIAIVFCISWIVFMIKFYKLKKLKQ